MTLYLPLKEKWYRMIESGEKKEEYREITPYWVQRLMREIVPYTLGGYTEQRIHFMDKNMVFDDDDIRRLKESIAENDRFFVVFTSVHFTLGYPKCDDASRHMFKRMKTIEIGCGRPEWGAEPNKEYFVIKWRERL